jgi:DNA polymerase III subunit epsilon
MKLALFYDTETTGLPTGRLADDHPAQPHIAQLGACLVDLDEPDRIISSLDVIVQPDGWTIPTEASDVHGITTAYAREVGIDEAVAVQLMNRMWQRATVRIGHNEQFDAQILRIAMVRHRHGLERAWSIGEAECTARLATPIMKLPPTARMVAAGRNHPKTPNLGEAYRHFTGRELVGAHSAMVDVRACMDVYFAIQKLRQPQAA